MITVNWSEFGVSEVVPLSAEKRDKLKGIAYRQIEEAKTVEEKAMGELLLRRAWFERARDNIKHQCTPPSFEVYMQHKIKGEEIQAWKGGEIFDPALKHLAEQYPYPEGEKLMIKPGYSYWGDGEALDIRHFILDNLPF